MSGGVSPATAAVTLARNSAPPTPVHSTVTCGATCLKASSIGCWPARLAGPNQDQ